MLTLSIAWAWAGGTARTAGAEPTAVSGATFEWSVNDESNTGAFNGDCNFMSAGESDGSVGTYRATDDHATVLKLTPTGGFAPVGDYATRCLDAEGVKVTAGGTRRLGQKVRYEGGTGTADPVSGEVQIQWTGTFAINFYGHLTPFWLSDPLLTVGPDGNGSVTVTVGGYRSSQDNPDVRELMDPVPDVVIATLSGVDSRNPDGFIATPVYEGVQISGYETPQNRFFPGWGSWPVPFIAAMDQLGSASYWYSSGGAADVRKPPAPLVVGFGEGTAPTTTTTTTTTVAPPTTAAPTTLTPTTVAPAPGTTVPVQADALASGASADATTTVGGGAREGTSRATTRSTTTGAGTGARTTSSGTTGSVTSTSSSPTLSDGTFGWTVDAGVSGVTLGAQPGNENGRRLRGELAGVTVVDRRSGAPAWSITGQVSDFTGGLSGSHLGWTPRVTTPGGGALPGAVVAPGPSAGNGLRDPAVLASAPTGHPDGATTVGAVFDLLLPSTAAAGSRSATLTITALG